jgi:4-diphosphocytidyl-2-C-methyl-D-erythritol kinase
MIRIRSYAKINLGLEVLGKRDNGYHEIRTLFQTIGLYDILEFRAAPGDEIFLTGTDKSISWGRDNLIYKAAALLKEQLSPTPGIAIHVTKNLPAGKGLGGGSSNAAMTLYALDKIWALKCQREALLEWASVLGADVPYFLEGGLCFGTGRGDTIKPLQDLPPFFCVVILPDLFVSTAAIYANFRSALTSGDKDSKIIGFLDNQDLGGLENGLEETVFNLYPQIKDSKSLLQSWKPRLSLVCGSGSALFGLFQEKQMAEKAFEELRHKHQVHLVETLSREHYWHNISAGV